MTYNLENETEVYIFRQHCDKLISDEKHVLLEEYKPTRTNEQNKARWLYLSQVAVILNQQGHTFTPPGFTRDVPFTKDNLYQIYWQTLRHDMFPSKTEQLTTEEFSKLVDMVQLMFNKLFDIKIPFPSMENKGLDELENY